MVSAEPEPAVGRAPLQDDTLFAVSSGGDGLFGINGGNVGVKGGDCFLSVAYGGQGYCVPTTR